MTVWALRPGSLAKGMGKKPGAYRDCKKAKVKTHTHTQQQHRHNVKLNLQTSLIQRIREIRIVTN